MRYDVKRAVRVDERVVVRGVDVYEITGVFEDVAAEYKAGGTGAEVARRGRPARVFVAELVRVAAYRVAGYDQVAVGGLDDLVVRPGRAGGDGEDRQS